jgi:hypothetical protein
LHKGISNIGPDSLQRGDNYKNSKNRVPSFRNHRLMYVAQSQTSSNFHERFLTFFVNSWFPGLRRSHKRVQHFDICLNRKNLLKSFQKSF